MTRCTAIVEVPVEAQAFVIIEVALPSVAKIATTYFLPLKESLLESVATDFQYKLKMYFSLSVHLFKYIFY